MKKINLNKLRSFYVNKQLELESEMAKGLAQEIIDVLDLTLKIKGVLENQYGTKAKSPLSRINPYRNDGGDNPDIEGWLLNFKDGSGEE